MKSVTRLVKKRGMTFDVKLEEFIEEMLQDDCRSIGYVPIDNTYKVYENIKDYEKGTKSASIDCVYVGKRKAKIMGVLKAPKDRGTIKFINI